MAGALAAGLAPRVGLRAAEADMMPFDAQTVRTMARALGASAFQPPDAALPDALAKLTYDAYRTIRFDPAQSLWRGAGLPFEAQFFHRGFLYANRVELYEVAGGQARALRYRPEQFDPGAAPRVGDDLGYAGFRLHGAINRADTVDEIAVFLGASYFRAVGKGLLYGLSARGLSIKTADPGGEEFPAFKAFWLERPQPGARGIVVTGLLDSPSAAAALRLSIRPGEDTVFDVELTLFPREDIAQAGIATMTSMFLFNALDHGGADDYRRAVHDSSGLMMLTGRNEALWRPVTNPQTLQVSQFADASPRGFGLMQRARALGDFEDLEARYDKRPSLWVEPIGDWGEGVVQLVEIPTKDEVHDNIVAFWRPKQPLLARSEHGFTYRLHWAADAPGAPALGRFTASRSGAGPGGTRLFVLDAAGGALRTLAPDAQPRLAVSTDRGKIQNAAVRANPEEDGWRMGFELLPEDAKAAELRVQLLLGDTPLTETWLLRWTA